MRAGCRRMSWRSTGHFFYFSSLIYSTTLNIALIILFYMEYTTKFCLNKFLKVQAVQVDEHFHVLLEFVQKLILFFYE